MCSQCDSDLDPFCWESPHGPENCTLCSGYDTETYECSSYREVEYCIAERRYINGTLVRIIRDCSPASMPDSCELITKHGVSIRVCFKTCKRSGCNSAERTLTSARNSRCVYLLLVFLVVLMG